MEEDFASIMDSAPPPIAPDKRQIKNVRYLFGKGLVIGMLIATSIGGIFQYLISDLEENELLRLFIKKFWYSVSLWAWIFCLLFFLFVALYIVRKIDRL